jgi:hypothetical protein
MHYLLLCVMLLGIYIISISYWYWLEYMTKSRFSKNRFLFLESAIFEKKGEKPLYSKKLTLFI